MANNFWYYPLDGAPSIVNAEMGVGIGSGAGGFYIDLAFSEDVYGASDGSSAVTASQFDFLNLHEVTYPDSHPFANPAIETTVALSVPTKVTNLDGSDLAGGADVIRLHYPASEHPNQRTLTDNTKLTAIGIRTPAGSGIFDGEGTPNELHGGNDWHMLVYHDRFAPYISAASVGLGSGRIDLTFSEPVKFGIEFNAAEPSTPTITNTEPSSKDFTITHYDASEGTATSFAPADVGYSGTLANGLTELMLMMPTNRTYASEDTVDIRIAEQVKEPLFPSLASVFDLTQKKGISSFPRTAAPAQIGSLQLRGRDTYTIQYTQSYTSAPAIADILTGSGTAHSGSVLEVAEGDNSDVRGIVIEIRRTESDPATVTLRINRGIGSTDEGVMFRLEGETSDITPPDNASVPVRFADGELEKRVAVRVVGNEGPTGNRQYTIALSPTNAATQQIGSPSGVRLLIREDDDAVPPVVSDRGSLEIVEFGATEVTLGWQEGTDENMLRYTLVVTEIGSQRAPATLNFEQTPGNSQMRVTRRFTRTDVVLIPGRTYSFALSVQDVFDNPTIPIAYTPVMETMLTAFAAGERDRYVNLTCSGGEFGDADGDGVPNNIENEIGSDCTDRDISRIGPADAMVPTITVNDEMIVAGAREVLNGTYIIVPGTGERTGIDLDAADCADCAVDSVRAYANTSDCRVNPGQARPGGDESVCPTSLSSFSNMLLWVGRDSFGNWISATSNYTVYVAPPVGFDVGVVSENSIQTSVDLPISVAVSSGAGNFSVGDLVVSGDTLNSGLGTGSGEQLSNQITVSGITVPSSVRLTAIGGFTFTSEGLSGASIAVGNVDGSNVNERLFSIGNASVSIVTRPPVTDPAVIASSSFRMTFTETERERSETTSDDISVPESTTARSGVYISVGTGIVLPSNSPPLRAEVTADVGVVISTETGVFDYAIDLSEPGDIATAVLRLSTAVQIPSEVYKFDGVTESWGPFIATFEGDTRYDRVYSAPATAGQCPELSGSRQPDDDSSGGDHGYAWNLAVLEGNNVRVGDECLLVQIQDGSTNDADGAVEGTIFDTIGLIAASTDDTRTPFTFKCLPEDEDVCNNVVFSPRGGLVPFEGRVRITGTDGAVITIGTMPSGFSVTPATVTLDYDGMVTVVRRRGGGGLMEPIWLLLLAFAMALPYGLRRRQSSPFISDL